MGHKVTNDPSRDYLYQTSRQPNIPHWTFLLPPYTTYECQEQGLVYVVFPGTTRNDSPHL